MAESDTTYRPSPERIDEWLNQRVGVRTAHEAALLQDAQLVLRANRNQVTAHNRMHGLDVPDEMAGDIHIGDVVNQTAPQPQQAAAQPQPAAKLPDWMKTAGVILGSLAAGGVGATAVSALWPDGEDERPAAAELNPGGMTIEVVEQPKQ